MSNPTLNRLAQAATLAGSLFGGSTALAQNCPPNATAAIDRAATGATTYTQFSTNLMGLLANPPAAGWTAPGALAEYPTTLPAELRAASTQCLVPHLPAALSGETTLLGNLRTYVVNTYGTAEPQSAQNITDAWATDQANMRRAGVTEAGINTLFPALQGREQALRAIAYMIGHPEWTIPVTVSAPPPPPPNQQPVVANGPVALDAASSQALANLNLKMAALAGQLQGLQDAMAQHTPSAETPGTGAAAHPGTPAADLAEVLRFIRAAQRITSMPTRALQSIGNHPYRAILGAALTLFALYHAKKFLDARKAKLAATEAAQKDTDLKAKEAALKVKEDAQVKAIEAAVTKAVNAAVGVLQGQMGPLTRWAATDRDAFATSLNLPAGTGTKAIQDKFKALVDDRALLQTLATALDLTLTDPDLQSNAAALKAAADERDAAVNEKDAAVANITAETQAKDAAEAELATLRPQLTQAQSDGVAIYDLLETLAGDVRTRLGIPADPAGRSLQEELEDTSADGLLAKIEAAAASMSGGAGGGGSGNPGGGGGGAGGGPGGAGGGGTLGVGAPHDPQSRTGAAAVV